MADAPPLRCSARRQQTQKALLRRCHLEERLKTKSKGGSRFVFVKSLTPYRTYDNVLTKSEISSSLCFVSLGIIFVVVMDWVRHAFGHSTSTSQYNAVHHVRRSYTKPYVVVFIVVSATGIFMLSGKYNRSSIFAVEIVGTYQLTSCQNHDVTV
jgi:hypothetical protein